MENEREREAHSTFMMHLSTALAFQLYGKESKVHRDIHHDQPWFIKEFTYLIYV